MAEFNLERFKYNWTGEWTPFISYKRDDVVRHGAKSYVCVVTHTADANFYVDLDYILPNSNPPVSQPKWKVMTDGKSTFVGDWTIGNEYRLGDVTLYSGTLYYCVVAHTAAEFGAEITNWSVLAIGNKFVGSWAPTTYYGPNALVKYNGIVYKCLVGHLSQSALIGIEDEFGDDSAGKWEVFLDGVEFVGNYAGGTRYRKNDLVKYGSSIWRCTVGHSGANPIDNRYFNVEFPGQNTEGDWNADNSYQEGDLVRSGGSVYLAIASTTGEKPDFVDSSSTWLKVSHSNNFRGDWDATATYSTGDLVRRGGELFRCVRNTLNDGSTLDYLDDNDWELVVPSQNWKGPWTQDTTYGRGDIVNFFGNTYYASQSHLSTDNNFPGDNGSGFNYWDLLVQSGNTVGMNNTGDLLTYNLSRRLQGDGSTFDVTNVPIGERQQVLMVDDNETLGYEYYSKASNQLYVSLDGIDDETDTLRGSIHLPFRTVKYAAEYADKNFNGELCKIFISTGRFEETLPIIVPKNCVIMGDELRSTTIAAGSPDPDLAVDLSYRKTVIARLRAIMPNMLSGGEFEKTPGNTFDFDNTFPASDSTNTNNLQVLLDTYDDYLDFYIGSIGNVADTEGNNGAETSTEVSYARDILLNNRNFIIGEATATMDNFRADVTSANGSEDWLIGATGNLTVGLPIKFADTIGGLEANVRYYVHSIIDNITFKVSKRVGDDPVDLISEVKTVQQYYDYKAQQVTLDISLLIEALRYDLLYPGNYKTKLAARYYTNDILGSNLEDMFYFRDATGMRQCTIEGLKGVLNPPGVFEFYQRPTAGAYASLDPGWGPEDERCWIMTRSPYIQGVTTLGTACIGMKVDGALHNGGNKSMTANDFTQVLSDGIGAWIDNNGRAELVSVFTYYNQVGYLATQGGVIRATNGNNSYGRYGAVAEGIDPNEISKTATVFNRNQDAQVSAVFAGEVSDFILNLEYSNAGQNYTNANVAFTGSGAQANAVFEDIRDGGLFEARLLTPPDSGSAGGSGYTLEGNNAQDGDETTITLATADDNDAAEYTGQRILITSGVGTGQYGYIQSYNSVTKVASVYKESNDEPGWDHVVAGTEIASELISSTTYRIEPRLTVNAPAFTAEQKFIPGNGNWVDVAFGGTTETFLDIAGEFGTGETTDVVAQVARFNVTKTGQSYVVTLRSGFDGAGYAVGDTITIVGASVGGTTPLNNIVITVTEISNDSTNSISNFTTTGIGTEGRFVSVLKSSLSAAYSSNGGDSWSPADLPDSGDWTAVAAGNNRFVAIRDASARMAYSLDGINWTRGFLPQNREWIDVIYAKNKFVAIAANSQDYAISEDGITWTEQVFPDVTSGGVGDSTATQWQSITYGKNKFVVLSNADNVIATSPTAGTGSWTVYEDALPVVTDWQSVAYGNNRYVAISRTNSEAAYSFDGETWTSATMPKQDGSSHHNWTKIRYGQGIFFAVGDTGSRNVGQDPTFGETTFAATSEDGIIWTNRELPSPRQKYRSCAFGSFEGRGRWMLTAENDIGDGTCRVFTGCRAKLRANINTGVFSEIKVWDPGSGYTAEDPAVITIVDNAFSVAVLTENRIGNGVLAQPSFVFRGFGYRTSSTRANISGDGFADIIPIGADIVVDNLDVYPGPGAQFLFASIPDLDTANEDDLKIFTVQQITPLGADDNGKLKAGIKLTPIIENSDSLQNAVVITIRSRYSQCRISGHDFLDIGTGNFITTNYPDVYSDGAYFIAAPENEVQEENGGRVFYTSTDQDGNFRAGELFSVQQATGIVTISAEFFDLDGLSELALGGVRLGGSGAVVREFSTDPNFTEDSNNVVPTQRAIATFLQNRLSQGGSALETGTLIAGVTRLGNKGTEDQYIDTTTGIEILLPRRMVIDKGAEISGTIVKQMIILSESGNDFSTDNDFSDGSF